MQVSSLEGYRRWAESYDDEPNPIVSLIDRHLEIPSGLVIDVGCGTSRRGGFGADLSPEMLARSANKGRVAQADARRLPFRHAAADTALCILALGYIQPASAVMAELRRITRPGGVIIAADLHPAAVAAGWKRSFRVGDTVYEIETYPYELDDDGLEQSRDLYFGEPERLIYAQAGKTALFDQLCTTPAVWMRRWRR